MQKSAPRSSELTDRDSKQVEDLASLVQAANQRSGIGCKIDRVANILRYYRTSQLLQRAIRTATPAFLSQRPRALSVKENVVVRDNAIERMRSIAATRVVRTTMDRKSLGDDLSQGRFTLLGQTCELGSPIDWHVRVTPSPSHLWRFQLHYHEYLLDLAADSVVEGAEDADVWPMVWRIVADWIDGNPLESSRQSSDAWHPFCISRRLPVWAQLFALSEPPENLRGRFLQSFACQAEVLSKGLEFDLGGNHLLENLTALALAGVFLDGDQSGKWLDLATRHLQKQLTLQILPHGEHYERAPMYHCQVLGNLLQVAIATAGVREELAEECLQVALRMQGFLQSILHPDDEIPLFGDSCWGETHSVEAINALAHLAELKVPAETKFPVTVVGPYWNWRDADDALIFDAGPVGTDNLPAHAHCDLLGFEASVAGHRWFVDSGLFDYDDGKMRDYCRSSAAHNVVTVDHRNCCDVWSRFRMGRRGRPTQLVYGQQGRFSWCQASHDGYRYFGVPLLSRMIVAHQSGVWVCLEHSPVSDVSLIGRLHLAPGVKLQQLDSQRLLLTRDGVQRWFTATPDVDLGQAEGWYCDRFGQRTRTQVITYSPRNSNHVGCTFGWSLSPTRIASPAVTIDRTAGQIGIVIDGDPEAFYGGFPSERASEIAS